MSIDNSVSEFLTGGAGAKSALLANIGDTITGTVVSADVIQQSDFATKKPKFWDDGGPMMQLRVILATNERDPLDPDDDGERALYLKGSKKDPHSSAGALVEALKQAKVSGLEVGGKLMAQYISDRPSNMGNPAKQWRIAYKAPALGAGFLDAPEPAAASAPTPAPAPVIDDPFAEF